MRRAGCPHALCEGCLILSCSHVATSYRHQLLQYVRFSEVGFLALVLLVGVLVMFIGSGSRRGKRRRRAGPLSGPPLNTLNPKRNAQLIASLIPAILANRAELIRE